MSQNTNNYSTTTTISSTETAQSCRSQKSYARKHIVINRLPKNYDHAALIKYLEENFGKVQNSQTAVGKHHSKCVVEFETTYSAKASLQRRYHNFRDYYFVIRPTTTAFTMIDVDSIAKIFSDLDLLQQIRLSLSHSQFEWVFKEYFCNKFRHMNTKEIIKMMSDSATQELQQYIKQSGEFVESVEMHGELALEDLVFKYCPNLKRFFVRGHFTNMEYTKFANATSLHHLTEVEFFSCLDLEDKHLEVLTTLPNLESLGLSNCENVSGTSIMRMRNVKRLSLFRCLAVTMDTLVKICVALELRYLDIRGNFELKNLNAIVVHCSELEVLKFKVENYGKGQEEIVKLPNLKSLELRQHHTPISDVFLNSLADYHSNDLEELTLHGGHHRIYHFMNECIMRLCKLRKFKAYNLNFNSNARPTYNFIELEEINLYDSPIGDHDLMELIKQCPNLKRLGLKNCPYLSVYFIEDLGIELRSRAEKALVKAPPLLVILTDLSGIPAAILKDPIYKNAQHLIRISFHDIYPLVGTLNEKSIFDVDEDEDH